MNTGLRLASISGINTTCSLKFEDIWDVKLHHFPGETMVQWQQKIEFLTQPFLIPLFICEDIPLCVVHYQSRCGSLVVIREGYDSWVLSSVYIHQDTSILSRGKKHIQCTSWISVTHEPLHSSISCTNTLLPFCSSYWFWFLQTYVGIKYAHSRPTSHYWSLQHSLQKHVQASFKSQRHGILQYEDLPTLPSSIKCHCLVGCRRTAWRIPHSPPLSHKACRINFQAKTECTENTSTMPALTLCGNPGCCLAKHTG